MSVVEARALGPAGGRHRGGEPPLRLGAQGHPPGPARRARRGARSARPRCRAAACSRRSTATSTIADADGNLVCQDTGIAVYHCRVGEGFPLHPARIYEALRDGTARATLEHPLRSNAVHTITREPDRPQHRPPAADRALGVRARLGRARRQVRAQGLGLGEHELPQDVRPGRRGQRDQALRARVDRRLGRQALPARDRRRRHRRLGRLRDVPRQGGDHAPGRHAQLRPARGGARGRALRAPERDRHRADGARRRRHGAAVPHRARRHAHDAQPRRRQLPVLGRAACERARRGRTATTEFDREA